MQQINFVIKEHMDNQLFDFYLQETGVWFIYTYNSKYTFIDIDKCYMQAFDSWISQETKEQKAKNNEVMPTITVFGYGLMLDIDYQNTHYQGYTDPIMTSIWKAKHTKDTFSLKIAPNFFSDYPRNKKTGELVDFTSFAYRNRERLDASMRRLEKLVEGEIIDWSPKQFTGKGPNAQYMTQFDINNQNWSAEEIYKYGYHPLTERKEEYERQEARKKQ